MENQQELNKEEDAEEVELMKLKLVTIRD